MRQFRGFLSTLVVATLLSVGMMSSPAQAAPAASGQAATVQAMLDDLVAANPGAEKISDNTVRLANGVEATAKAPDAAPSCPYTYLCIYDLPNFRGYHLDFYKCGFVNIGTLGWSDRIQSYENDQTPGTVSIFMNWNGSNWEELSRSTAYGASAIVGNAHWTDGLWVC